MNLIYTASKDLVGRPYVEGPGLETVEVDRVIFPRFNLSTTNDAISAAFIANSAFAEGYEQARREIRAALGVKQ